MKKKYRLIFETSNPQLYSLIQDQTRETMHEYSIRVEADRKETRSSYEVKMKAQMPGNEKLKNRKSNTSDRDYIDLDE